MGVFFRFIAIPVPISISVLIPIPVSIFGRALHGHIAGLSGSPIGIQDAQAARVLLAVPGEDENYLALLQCAGGLNEFAINQETRAGLDATPGQANGRGLPGMRGQHNGGATQVGNLSV